jgi:hypothetical protein
MNGWPSRSDSHWPISRATMSMLLPAGNPTMTCTGRVGYVCAQARRAIAGAALAAICRNLRRERFIAILSLDHLVGAGEQR